MKTTVLICDDSALARKQVARALPAGWDVELSFAESGEQALEAIRRGKADILFLDLNMPGIDGYQVLDAIRTDDLPTMVIVVSGDLQPEAHERVNALGAIAFLQKPVSSAVITETLTKFGILGDLKSNRKRYEVEFEIWDGYKEVANVAMGRAADLLARLLGAFVLMPIPNVNMIGPNELRMALSHINDSDTVSAVCQGFIGAGVAGEALLIFTESSYPDIARLMKYDDEIDSAAELELLMDTANVLIGACLKGIAEQLDLSISQGHPIVLGRHLQVGKLLNGDTTYWTSTLAIEMGYAIENWDIKCDLLLLFTEDSQTELNRRISCLCD